jgi:hypothetical protein
MKCESGKKCFSTQEKAEQRAEEFRLMSVSIMMRAYECPMCGYHHLTSQVPEEYDDHSNKMRKSKNYREKIKVDTFAKEEAPLWEKKLTTKKERRCKGLKKKTKRFRL